MRTARPCHRARSARPISATRRAAGSSITTTPRSPWPLIFRRGVFTLGETGYVDDDGYVFITDRVSDMIVSGGVNIYPAEAEQVLIRHPGVADVAVIGAPNAEMGEEVKALVIPADPKRPPWSRPWMRSAADPWPATNAREPTTSSPISGATPWARSTSARARLVRSGLVDPSAFSAYLRGRYLWNRRTAESLQKATLCFQEAIAHDPAYAPAHAGIADCCALLTSIHLGVMPPTEGMPRAIAAAEKALELDPELAEAHASLGQASLWYEYDWPAARACFERALKLNPSYAPALQWHAAYLQTLDRVDEALAELVRALEVDPLSLVIRSAREATLYLERRYQQVIEESRKTLELDPTFVLTYFNLGRAYTQVGNHRQAIAELKKACELSADSPAMIMQLGYAYARGGKTAEAKRMLGTLAKLARQRYVPAFYSAAIYAGLRDKKMALLWLTKAHDERCDYLVHLPKEPAADPIRDTAEFARLAPRPVAE